MSYSVRRIGAKGISVVPDAIAVLEERSPIVPMRRPGFIWTIEDPTFTTHRKVAGEVDDLLAAVVQAETAPNAGCGGEWRDEYE